jgi:hypothetical protein
LDEVVVLCGVAERSGGSVNKDMLHTHRLTGQVEGRVDHGQELKDDARVGGAGGHEGRERETRPVLSDHHFGCGKGLELLSEREATQLHELDTDTKLLVEDFDELSEELSLVLDGSPLVSGGREVEHGGVDMWTKIVVGLQVGSLSREVEEVSGMEGGDALGGHVAREEDDALRLRGEVELREDDVSDGREGRGGALCEERIEEGALAGDWGRWLVQQGEGRHAEARQVNRLTVGWEGRGGGERDEAKGGKDGPQKRQEIETDVQHIDSSAQLTSREGVLRVGEDEGPQSVEHRLRGREGREEE